MTASDESTLLWQTLQDSLPEITNHTFTTRGLGGGSQRKQFKLVNFTGISIEPVVINRDSVPTQPIKIQVRDFEKHLLWEQGENPEIRRKCFCTSYLGEIFDYLRKPRL